MVSNSGKIARDITNSALDASVTKARTRSLQEKDKISKSIFDRLYNAFGHYFPTLYTLNTATRNFIKGVIITAIGYIVQFLITTFIAAAAATPLIWSAIVLLATLLCLYRYVYVPLKIQRTIYLANIEHANAYRFTHQDVISNLLNHLKTHRLKQRKASLGTVEGLVIKNFYEKIGIDKDWSPEDIIDLHDLVEDLKALRDIDNNSLKAELNKLIDCSEKYLGDDDSGEFKEALKNIQTLPIDNTNNESIIHFNSTLLSIESTMSSDNTPEGRALKDAGSDGLRIAQELREVLLQTNYSRAKFTKHREVIKLIFTEEEQKNLPSSFIDDIFQLTDIISRRAKIKNGEKYLHAGGQLNTGRSSFTDLSLAHSEQNRPAAIRKNLKAAFSTTPIYLTVEKADLLAKTLRYLYNVQHQDPVQPQQKLFEPISMPRAVGARAQYGSVLDEGYNTPPPHPEPESRHN